jgi:hypothetical protein
VALSLKESRAVAGIAELLYDFLPGSGSPAWKGHISFGTVAEKVGLREFYQPGNKRVMITTLLQRTLEQRRDRFERLILEVVRAGITYRDKQQRPLQISEVDRLNGLLLELGFKFPDLWDPDFMTSLRIDSTQRARGLVDQALENEKIRAQQESRRAQELRQLRDDFFALPQELTPQNAGRRFETILNRLFALHGLAPREPFRVIGEQIDGSFDLDHETYLVEAKWVREPIPEATLLTFRGKIEGKSAYTRGVFVALNGVTSEARDAITRGKQPTFFVMNGYDVNMSLADEVGLIEFLRQRRRLLAEEGLVVVAYPELWQRSRPKDP